MSIIPILLSSSTLTAPVPVPAPAPAPAPDQGDNDNLRETFATNFWIGLLLPLQKVPTRVHVLLK